MLADAGDTAMEATVDVLMVVMPAMLPDVAVIVVDPIVRKAVATP